MMSEVGELGITFPSCRCGEKRFMEGGISTISEVISEKWVKTGKSGHFGEVIVAYAPDCRKFAARSSTRDHGGPHLFVSRSQSRFGRWMESTVSICPYLTSISIQFLEGDVL